MDSILTPGEGLFCTGCGIFCEYWVVKSNKKGNKGWVMVSVSLASVLFLLYLTFPNQCNQVKDSISCNFFWWKKGSTWSPTASPTLTTTSPNLPTPSPTLPTSPMAIFDAACTVPNPANVLHPVAQKLHPVISRSVTTVCPVPGCNQSRIHPDCQRRVCRKHCVLAGGCSLKTHMGTGAASQVIPPTQTATSSALAAPSPSEDKSILVVVPSTPELPPATAPAIDAQPNRRHVSHMPPIFTDQYHCEQELLEKNRITEAQHQQLMKQSKHGIVVYAWAKVHYMLFYMPLTIY